MADKPQDVQHIVISVPHSGTRTLQTWLSENRPEIVPDHRTEVGHWHFSMHPKYIDEFFSIGGAKRAYIPVRNPFNVCDSWERRYGRAPDKTAETMVQAIGFMVDCVNNFPDNVEIFKMEDLPVLRGIGPRPEGWCRDEIVGFPRLVNLKRWILQSPAVEAFYRTYYNGKELWWL